MLFYNQNKSHMKTTIFFFYRFVSMEENEKRLLQS